MIETSKTANTLCLSFKARVPQEFCHILDSLYDKSKVEVEKMLQDRSKRSSKFYPEIPCVVAKGLISKYQKNKKCKKISNLVLPICGDKGKQVKIVEGGLRIPALFKKEVVPLRFPRPIDGFVRQVEFFRRDKSWFMSYQYNVKKEQTVVITNSYIGVDRNSVGNVVSVAMPDGATKLIGPSTAGIAKNFRNRRAKLQSKGKKEALKKIKRKQSDTIRDINHKVSRAVVNLASKHRSAIVLEDLGTISKKGKAKKYVQKSQWSFFQLETFIKYKAALSGIPVVKVPAAYTSQTCNKCGSINKPNGKHYKCECGYVAHRDRNAAVNIRDVAMRQGRSNLDLPGPIGSPLNWRLQALSQPESLGGVQ